MKISLDVLPKDGAAFTTEIDLHDLVIAGWTGRDAAAIERHIRELEEIGVARPKSTPMFYRVSTDRLTSAQTIDVIGKTSTGEVEFVLFRGSEELFVGVGSDHTDRKAEVLGVTLSKQLCPKPIGRNVWRWRDLADHWDELRLRCCVESAGDELVYQEGAVTAMLHPEALLQRCESVHGECFQAGQAMFCGTLAAKTKIEWAAQYRIELHDPVLGRTLTHSYSVRSLPIVD